MSGADGSERILFPTGLCYSRHPGRSISLHFLLFFGGERGKGLLVGRQEADRWEREEEGDVGREEEGDEKRERDKEGGRVS
jgi:hypothetical protein